MESSKRMLVAAVVAVASLAATPHIFSQDQRARWQGSVGSPDRDEWAHRSDHSECQPLCRDASCDEERWANDHGDREERHEKCQPSCLERKRCNEVAVQPQYAAIATGGAIQFTALTKGTNGVSWSVTAGMIDADGYYIAPSGPQSLTVKVTATSKRDPDGSATAILHVVAPGQVSPTTNVQVALYSISPGAPANVAVQFGKDTNYLLTTWEQPVPEDGGTVNLLVAGMVAETPYHMRAVVKFRDGSEFLDSDNTFLTGSIPSALLPAIDATTTPGMSPQPGIELLDTLTAYSKNPPLVMATDLNGNVIWTYTDGDLGGTPQPIKLLPNGHFLINYLSTNEDPSTIQEVDLSGTLIWQMTATELNVALAKATCAGCNVSVYFTHHDLAPLPNGHILLIAQTSQNVSGTELYGDVIIDLDKHHKPVWLWNEFDHLDTNRRPFDYLTATDDWTHSNAIVYSPDDGNFIVSMRNQSWLVKVDYRDGKGDGGILWKMGNQGDFALIGGTDPTDWFYNQHGFSFVSKNTAGIYTIAVFDNGDNRIFPPGVTCGGIGAPICRYSTVPILQIDETAMTATIVSHLTAPGYSFFGGNAEVLPNGNLEFCETAVENTAGNIYEVLPGENPQTVLHMGFVPSIYVYRGFRIPSLYPDVKW